MLWLPLLITLDCPIQISKNKGEKTMEETYLVSSHESEGNAYDR